MQTALYILIILGIITLGVPMAIGILVFLFRILISLFVFIDDCVHK